MTILEYQKLENAPLVRKWSRRIHRLTPWPFNLPLLFPFFLTNHVDAIELPSLMQLLEENDYESDSSDSNKDVFEHDRIKNSLHSLEFQISMNDVVSTLTNKNSSEVKLPLADFDNLPDMVDPERRRLFFDDLCNRFRTLLQQRRFSSLMSILSHIPLNHNNPVLHFFSALCYQAIGDMGTSLAIFQNLENFEQSEGLQLPFSAVVDEALKGNYNLKEIFSEYSTDPFTGCLHSEYHSTALNFKPLPPFGLGVFANRNIEEGEMLLVERALVLQFPGSKIPDCDPLVTLAKKLMSLQSELPEKLKKMILTLPRRSGWSSMIKKIKKDQELSLGIVKKVNRG
ncbi:hypothetical protein GEMRC1_010936 [Eukaryota sp. GEM-RC1]